MSYEHLKLHNEIKYLSNLIDGHKKKRDYPQASTKFSTRTPATSSAGNCSIYKLRNSAHSKITKQQNVTPISTANVALKKEIAVLEAAIKVHKENLNKQSKPSTSFNNKFKYENNSLKPILPRKNSTPAKITKFVPNSKRSTYIKKATKSSNISRWDRFKIVKPNFNTRIGMSSPNKPFVRVRHRYQIKRLQPTHVSYISLQWRKLRVLPSHFVAPRKHIIKNSNEKNGKKTLKVVQIGGIWYRSSSSKLQKTNLSQKSNENNHISQLPSKSASKTRNSSKIISVRGVKFSLDTSKKQLVRMNSGNSQSKVRITRVDLGGVTYLQTKPGLLQKKSSSHHKVSQAVNRSINRVNNALQKKMIKKDKYCMFYNRYGHCNNQDKCKFIHDPKKIAVCTRFLQGKCKMKTCPFSHIVAKNRMPVCLYFLRGRCNLDDCPYLHVNVNASAKPCKEFLQGFCPNGLKCKKLHSILCPTFAKTGKCPQQSSCPMKHQNKKKRTAKSSQVDKSYVPETDTTTPAFIALNETPSTSSKPATLLNNGDSLNVRPLFLATDAS